MLGKPFAALRKQTVIQTSLFDFTFDPPQDRAGDILYVNSLAFYDLMPKYVFNSRYTKRRSGGQSYRTLDKVAYGFTLNGRRYTNIITPARISRSTRDGGRDGGGDIDMYPGKREQVIEWAVRIAAKRGAGTLLLDTYAGAEFTLYQLQKICAELGHEMSYAQLREGLMVMMKSNIQTICEDGPDQFTASSTLFPLGAIRERQQNSKATRTYVAFHPFVTAGIKDVNFRQIDIKKVTAYPGAIARWLHLKLMHSYVFADGVPGGQTFNLNASTIIACSGAGPFARPRDGIAAVRKALASLHAGGDIEANPAERRHLSPSGSVIDVTFDIRGTRTFAKAVKTSLGAHRVVKERLAARDSAKIEAAAETARRIESAKGALDA
jgi:hypothetical protein